MIEHGSQISFEFFPPADAKMDAALWRAVETLAPFAPSFVSVTYGADGSTRDRTRSLVQRIARDSRLIAVPHLTCVGATREETLEIAQRYWQDGVRHIVALRGDAPQGSDGYRAHPGGFAYARDLVEGLRSVAPFEISVAAYPQTHPEALSAEADLDNLRAKFEAGASRAITQFFFETDDFLHFRDRCAAAGITGPMVPGILPIARFSQVARFAARCGAKIPERLAQRFAGLEQDPAAHAKVALDVAIEQVSSLRRHGVRDFHFYTLNRAELTAAICEAMQLRAAA
jgi:methylenetetrahydrofolate reductase (NADPH)